MVENRKSRNHTSKVSIDSIDGVQLTYHETMEAYHIDVSSDCDEPISTVLLLALSAISGTDPIQMKPLGDHIDQQALDDLMEHPEGDDSSAQWSMTFEYNSYLVTIEATGEITITEIPEESPRFESWSEFEGRDATHES